MNRWWEQAEDEVYWLELTDREDIGADLRAPLHDDSGKDNWRYTLFQATRPGDVVFHYDTRRAAIVARSVVIGAPFEHSIVWGARGSYAREKHTRPRERPGYRVPIGDYEELSSPVTIQDIEDAKGQLKRGLAHLQHKHGAVYFPFELSAKRRARPLQGYAFKFPRFLLEVFAGLSDATIAAPTADLEAYDRRARSVRRQWKRQRLPKKKPGGRRSPKKVAGASNMQFERDPKVKAWVVAEANGRCELCGSRPFEDIHGEPFLELHHVKWLAQKGPDTVENAVALCPNCHRACHHSGERDALLEQLYSHVKRLVRS